MRFHRKIPKGFTLVEVMIAATIALVVSLAVASALYYNQKAQDIARQRTVAQRIAAALLEDARRQSFATLRPVEAFDVVVDDRRTPPAAPGDPNAPALADDIHGPAQLQLFRHSAGTELDVAAGEDFLLVQAQVRWTYAGKERVVTLNTHFAP